MQHIGCSASCYDNDASDGKATKSVTLTFYRDQLLYDIKNCAYVEGHVWGDENQHAQHTLVDIGEDGNVDRVDRVLGLAHAAAVEALYPYAKEEAIEGEEICDRAQSTGDYAIRLQVPAAMSRTTLRLLSQLVHEFMVARALGDWLTITHPEAAGNWLGKALEAQQEINTIKNSRTGALRRPSYPF